ncbi:FAD-dependent oxidoreductase, partial [Streptomyces mutabilis]|uniref:FAD-dependent oxidoreductase n=1 Tax=Streptomyces mutabilis TaxID=67332 RepID=UPI0036ADA019
MLEPAYQADVVVVGAGIAGLAAAHRLTSQGVTTTVLEAAPPGGGGGGGAEWGPRGRRPIRGPPRAGGAGPRPHP